MRGARGGGRQRQRRGVACVQIDIRATQSHIPYIHSVYIYIHICKTRLQNLQLHCVLLLLCVCPCVCLCVCTSAIAGWPVCMSMCVCVWVVGMGNRGRQDKLTLRPAGSRTLCYSRWLSNRVAWLPIVFDWLRLQQLYRLKLDPRLRVAFVVYPRSVLGDHHRQCKCDRNWQTERILVKTIKYYINYQVYEIRFVFSMNLFYYIHYIYNIYIYLYIYII